MRADSPQPLTRLLSRVTDTRAPNEAKGLMVHRITDDARAVEPGDLFVALAGHQTDGHLFVAEAVRRGAVAVIAQRDPGTKIDAPVILVPNTRRALARLAAAWNDLPTRDLALIGITGSFGKTGTLNMLQAILLHGGIRAGIIGSDFIGLRLPGHLHEPGELTTPGPLALHDALRRIAHGGGELCAMEVTSQGLVQERVCGLDFALGIFTALAPLEHSDYHHSFRNYIEAKVRFFEHLLPGAPLIYPAADPVFRGLLEGRRLTPVGCGPGPLADVRIRDATIGPGQVRMSLQTREPLPALGGGTVEPFEIRLELPLLGWMNARNAALAATAALCCGATPSAVRRGLAAVQPPPRRLELGHVGGFHLLDDTATHPESLNIIFDVIGRIPHERLHLVTAIRGGRGAEFNHRFAETLGIWARQRHITRLITTESTDIIDEPDRVLETERAAFLNALETHAVDYVHQSRLEAATQTALSDIRPNDLLVLLGAQGMHPGAEMVRRAADTSPEGRPIIPGTTSTKKPATPYDTE